MVKTLDRIRAEFTEMPGLRLSAAQVQRLCGIDATVCQAVLDALVDVKFLSALPDHTYIRFTGSTTARHVARSVPKSAVISKAS